MLSENFMFIMINSKVIINYIGSFKISFNLDAFKLMIEMTHNIKLQPIELIWIAKPKESIWINQTKVYLWLYSPQYPLSICDSFRQLVLCWCGMHINLHQMV